MKSRIIPSAPFKNFGEIEKLVLEGGKEIKRIQIDVCDGEYVKSVSWPFTEFPKNEFAKLKDKVDLDVYLPNWENMDYGVDLMVKHPQKYIPTFVSYGVDQVFIHFRSVQIEDDSLKVWKEIFDICDQYELDLILTLDVQTDMEEFLYFANTHIQHIKGFQVMGIENIGYQGQELDNRSLEYVSKLKEEFPRVTVYFDGGINDETISEIAVSGVDIFCVGSYLTKSENFSEDLAFLEDLIY